MRGKNCSLKLVLLIGVGFIVYLPNYAIAETIKIGGTGAAIGPLRVLAEAFKKSNSAANVIIVPALGSGGARKAILGGAIDVAVTSQPGGKAEKVEGAVATEYGRTPFVFATSNKNNAANLTLQELVTIYSGKTLSWPDGNRLRLILRPETDSDTDLLKAISPAMDEAVKIALKQEGMKIAVTDQDSADAIETIPGALGTSSLALIISEKRRIKPLAVDGVTPNVTSAANGSYRYFKSLYMITRDEAPELAQNFLAFVRSPAGRKVLVELGHWIPQAKAGQ